MTEQTPPPLLLVDDDEAFREVLTRALERRGFSVTSAHNIESALDSAATNHPSYAVVDLRMPGESGLTLIPDFLEINPHMKIVVLTGYASITTAVEAIKLGAIYYLTKPTDADEIVAAFDRTKGDVEAKVPDTPVPLQRLEWEHIQKVLTECGGNISQAARKLKMHRRTLQRKLQKRPVRMG